MYFASSNEYSSFQTQGGGAERAKREGWCAAGSAIWCSNILVRGSKPEDSEPNPTRAGLLQVKYRWDPAANGQDVLTLLENVDLHGELVEVGDRDVVLEYMQAHPDVYWFRTPGHAMALDSRPRQKLWYDIENGLFGYNSMYMLRWDLGLIYRPGSAWEAFRCFI
jgi:hypothetical protein